MLGSRRLMCELKSKGAQVYFNMESIHISDSWAHQNETKMVSSDNFFYAGVLKSYAYGDLTPRVFIQQETYCSRP